MKKGMKKTLSVSTMASLLITSSAVAINVKAAGVTPPESPRLWGQDRYETAVKVSQAGWESSDYAIIASGEGYADALSAAPLAKVNNAPILLTQKDSLSQNTLDELKRLNVKHVIIVGGQGVVSQQIEDKIKSEVTSDVERLWGQNRYETSVKVAEKLGVTDKIVLASGEGYADALSAAPVAAINGMPILLTSSSTLSQATSDFIKANPSITKTYVIGGTASVSDATMNQVPSAERLGGANRYETNAAVVNAFATEFDFKNAYVALGNGPSGNEFADALSASALAAKNGAAVIITDKVLTDTTKNLMNSTVSPSSVITVLGGVANVSDSVVSGMKISASFLSEAGATVTDTIDGNADITADNVTLKGNVKGDLYLEGNNASLSNITVDGTIYLNPGASGVSNLDTVTAKNIVVLSGAQDSIHLKNVTAGKLTVQSKTDVRVQTEGATAIGATIVKSKAILDAASGSFGAVEVANTMKDKTVEFRGTFDKLVTINGQVDLKTTATANLVGVLVSSVAHGYNIAIDGEGTIKNVQVKNETAKLNIGKNIDIRGIIETINKDNIQSDNSSIISKVEEKSGEGMSDIGNTTSGGTGSSGGSGSSGGGVSYTNITNLVSGLYESIKAEYLAAHPTLNNDISSDITVTTGDTIVVKINNQNWTSISGLFANAQNDDIEIIESRLNTLQGILDLNTIANIKLGDTTLSQYIQQLYPSDFTEDGRLDIDVIASKIAAKDPSYENFNANLKNKIKDVNEGLVGPNVTVSSYVSALEGTMSVTVDKIAKDGQTIYHKSWSEDQNLAFLSKDSVSDITGLYTIYSGNNIIKVQITK